jgi:hypothetical protein
VADIAPNPNPIDNEDLYNVVVLAGKPSPGVVKLSGHDRELDWDVKTGPGTKGGTTTLKGEKPIEFTASFYLADRDDFDAWPDFQALVESTVSGAKPKGLDIYHPDLARNDIRSVVKRKIGGVAHDGKGGQTIVVTFLEYRPVKPKGGTTSGSKTKPTDPDAAALAELGALTDKYQKTPWG